MTNKFIYFVVKFRDARNLAKIYSIFLDVDFKPTGLFADSFKGQNISNIFVNGVGKFVKASLK